MLLMVLLLFVLLTWCSFFTFANFSGCYCFKKSIHFIKAILLRYPLIWDHGMCVYLSEGKHSVRAVEQPIVLGPYKLWSTCEFISHVTKEYNSKRHILLMSIFQKIFPVDFLQKHSIWIERKLEKILTSYHSQMNYCFKL